MNVDTRSSWRAHPGERRRRRFLATYLPAHPRDLQFEAVTDGLAGWRGCAGQSGYGIPQPRTNWNASQPSMSRRNDVRRLGGA
jgi:hypothetical protein